MMNPLSGHFLMLPGTKPIEVNEGKIEEESIRHNWHSYSNLVTRSRLIFSFLIDWFVQSK